MTPEAKQITTDSILLIEVERLRKIIGELSAEIGELSYEMKQNRKLIERPIPTEENKKIVEWGNRLMEEGDLAIIAPTQHKIWELIKGTCPKLWTPKEITKTLNLSRKSVTAALPPLKRKGFIKRAQHGMYREIPIENNEEHLPDELLIKEEVTLEDCVGNDSESEVEEGLPNKKTKEKDIFKVEGGGEMIDEELLTEWDIEEEEELEEDEEEGIEEGLDTCKELNLKPTMKKKNLDLLQDVKSRIIYLLKIVDEKFARQVPINAIELRETVMSYKVMTEEKLNEALELLEETYGIATKMGDGRWFFIDKDLPEIPSATDELLTSNLYKEWSRMIINILEGFNGHGATLNEIRLILFEDLATPPKNVRGLFEKVFGRMEQDKLVRETSQNLYAIGM